MHARRLAMVSAAALLWASTSAQALNTRTWISGTGTDSASCGPIVSPCRTLQFAHDNTSSGGEIDVKDSADYGSVVITKAINIVAKGVIAAVSANRGNAITINAGTDDAVYLQGLTVEGGGAARNGVVLVSGVSLIVTNCTIRGFAWDPEAIYSGTGILLRPTSSAKIAISDTVISGNGVDGVSYSPATSAAINVGIVATRLLVESNYSGIDLRGSDNGSHTVEIIDSTASHNTFGVSVKPGVFAIIDNSRILKNSIYGVFADGKSTTFLRRSTIFGNEDTGVFVGSNTTTVYSYRDNSINANLTDLGGDGGRVLIAPLR